MIVRSLCNSCLQTYELMIEPSDIGLIKQIATEDGQQCPCPRLCGGKINLVGDPGISAASDRLKPPLHIGAKELYKAVHGAGLPDEIPNDPEIVASLLVANRVRSVVMDTGHKGVYLTELELENNVTIHLTAGAFGAQVLKITKKS